MEAGAQPRVSAREAYPRRAEHNTVAVGGNRRWAEIAEWRSNRAGRGRTDAPKKPAKEPRPTRRVS